MNDMDIDKSISEIANPITRLVNGPMSATLPNLFLSDNPTMTAPGAINLNGIMELLKWL